MPDPNPLERLAQEAPVSLAGQLIIGAARVEVGDTTAGQRALVITPAGQTLQIIVPLTDEASKTIGAAMLAKRVVLPNQMAGPVL
jgi:hypothetical protein